MGLFKIFKKKATDTYNNKKYAKMFNGTTPIFSQFGKNIYASDVVQQAINCIAQEMKKLNPTHIIIEKDTHVPSRKDIQEILDYPNDLMTISDLIEKVVWQLFFNYNAFIFPTFIFVENKQGNKVKKYTGLYPLAPSQVDFLEDPNGILYVKMTFSNGYHTTLKYNDIIHIRKNYSVNDFMGGNEQGQADTGALLKTLELNDILLQGVGKALKSSFIINGIVKYKTMLDDGTIENNIKELEQKLKNNESGLLPLDLSAEYIPINRQIQLVDDRTLKFIDEKILRNYGVPLSILTGDFTKTQQEAFYQKTLEPIIVSISQAFTKTLFNIEERRLGNKIYFYAKELVFMTMSEKLEFVRLLGDSGGLYENEKRSIFGLKPDPALDGVRNKSLNYVSVEIANEYQLQQASKQKKGESEDEK